MSARRGKVTMREALSRFPPYYVRLLAKNGGKALSDAEIAITAGIPINRVREIKFMQNWDHITFQEFDRFVSACNFDPTNPIDRERHYYYERQCTRANLTPFRYARKHPKWESEMLPMLKMLVECQAG